MIKIKYLLVIILLQVSNLVFAQSSKLTGKVVSAEDSLLLPGAVIIVKDLKDSSLVLGAKSDMDGNFVLFLPQRDSLLIIFDFIGYQRLYQSVFTDSNEKFLGTISLLQAQTELDAVVIQGIIPPVIYRGDTIEFYAGAFQSTSDVYAKDLLDKLPGMDINQEHITFNSENIVQILIDGKPYFGTDLNAVLLSFPAGNIDRVQIYKKLSDQARFTGFDDGQSIKTINIVTKHSIQNSTFGKATASLGNNNIYSIAGNVNLFQGNRRIAIIGTKNTNKYFGNSFSKTNEVGVNFIDSITKHSQLNVTYAINNSGQKSDQQIERKYFTSSTDNLFYKESSTNDADNYRHKFNLQYEYNIKDRATLLISPDINYQLNRSNNTSSGITESDSLIRSIVQNELFVNSNDFNFANLMQVNYRFKKKGRSLSTRYDLQIITDNSIDTLRAKQFNSKSIDSIDLLQKRKVLNNSYSHNIGTKYTEALGSNSLFLIGHTYTSKEDIFDNEVYNHDLITSDFYEKDLALTNTSKAKVITNAVDFSLKVKGKSYNLTTSIELQNSSLRSELVFPTVSKFNRDFFLILPNSIFSYKFSKDKSISISFQTTCQLPSAYQLSAMFNTDNYLFITAGNPDLDPQRQYTLNALANLKIKKTFASFNISATNTSNLISQSTNLFIRDTVIGNGLVLHGGSQLIKPVNLTGALNFRANFNLNRPLPKIKSNFNVCSYVNYFIIPFVFNDTLTYADNYSYYTSFGLTSHSKGRLEYIILFNSSFNKTENYNAVKISQYFLINSTIKVCYLIGNEFYFKSDILFNATLGSTILPATNNVVWNVETFRRFSKKKNLEIKLSFIDLLNQQKILNRTITNAYIQDSNTNISNRTYLLTLTYNINLIKHSKIPSY